MAQPSVGRIGRGAHPRFLDRMAGMYPMQLRYGAIVQALFVGASTPDA